MVKGFNYSQFWAYLCKCHKGEDCGIERSELCEKFGLTPKELRKVIKEINENPSYDFLISGGHSCYVCTKPSEEFLALQETANSIIRLMQKLILMEDKCNGKIKIATTNKEKAWIKGTFLGE